MTTPREKECPLRSKEKIAKDRASFLLLFGEMRDMCFKQELRITRLEAQLDLVLTSLELSSDV